MLRQLIVNGESIDPQLISDTFYRIKAQVEMNTELSCCDRDGEFWQEAENEVIDGILLAQEAERRIATIDEDIWRTAYEQVLREWRQHGASWDMLEQQGSALRQETLARLRMELFTKQLFASIDTPTDSDLRDFYRSTITDYWQPGETALIHLLRVPIAGQEVHDYLLLNEIRAQAIADPARFAELAQQHTQKNQQLIDLGWVRHERLCHPFESIIFSLQPMEISPIIFHENAYHLIQAKQLRDGRLREFDEVRDELVNRWRVMQQKNRLRELALNLRQSAIIQFRMDDVTNSLQTTSHDIISNQHVQESNGVGSN